MTRRRGWLRLTPVMLLALSLGAGVSCSRQAGGPTLPAVVLDTLEAGPLDLRELGGSPALVVFFSIDNPLALDELGRLEGFAHDLRDRSLELVAVALSSERPELVRTVFHQRQFLFPVAMDPAGAAATAFGGVTATPTVFLVSPDGRVVARTEGKANIAALRATIERM
jgi:peroxiredoxin